MTPHSSSSIRPRGCLTLAVLCALLMGGVAPSPLHAQTAENVAVVINDNSPISQRIGDYYVKKRGIPASNVLRIKTSTDEMVDRTSYVATIEAPLASALTREGLQDRVLYLVLTKGVPLRVEGSVATNGTVSSVDSEVTLLYRRMIGQPVPIPGHVDNPYFLDARDIATARQFSHRDYDIYLVSRLDAFTVDEALALVDRGMTPVTTGRIVLDQQDKLVNRLGETWLEQAATRLTAGGYEDRVLLEKTVQGVRDVSPVLGYYSWGSNDPRNRVRKVNLGFVPGSLAATFVSSDARTFKEPPADWVPSESADRAKWFEKSPQSLIGDLIREGATGVAGHVAEPYLQSTVRPQVLFSAYLAGFNLIESFYLAIPHLSWQTVVVGDPLCAPFRKSGLTRADLDAPIDAETQLPALFSKRRLANLATAQPGISERALALVARAGVLSERGSAAQARAAIEQATQIAPTYSDAHMQLALLYEQANQPDAAIERYRRVIELQPRQVAALNNLAYRLAIDKNLPAEALPFAQRAVALAPQSPVVLDTLAWVQHLNGDDAGAVKTMAVALRAAPPNAEIRLHAAVIYAGTGARAVALDQLREAVKLDPELENSEQVKQLRQQLDTAAAAPAPPPSKPPAASAPASKPPVPPAPAAKPPAPATRK